MHLSEFDYHLPEDRIAQEPLADRAASRMLVVHREEGRWEDRMFRDLPEYLRVGDCLVLNDSKVFPARLQGRKETGGKLEVFLLKEVRSGTWELAGPSCFRMSGRVQTEVTAPALVEFINKGADTFVQVWQVFLEPRKVARKTGDRPIR